MVMIEVWYEIRDGQDGTADLEWSLTKPPWREFQMDTGTVQTFEGSDIHVMAAYED